MNKIRSAFLRAFVLFSCAGIAQAAEDLSPIPKVADEWRFELTPYLWGSGVKSTLNFDNRYVKTADLSTSNVLSNLKTGAMIAGEAHYGSWGVMADFVSATLQKSGEIPVTIPTRKDGDVRAKIGNTGTLQNTIFTAAVTYTALNNKDAYVDGLLGFRTISSTASLGLNVVGTPVTLNSAQTTTTTDPIVGLKGRYRIADSTWYVPFYGDIGSGGGTTNLTWQAMLGVGKTFAKWVDVSLTYRTLYYDMNGGGLLQKTTFQGPQLAATFNF